MTVTEEREGLCYGLLSKTGVALGQKETQLSQVLTKNRLQSGQHGRPEGKLLTSVGEDPGSAPRSHL